MKLSRSGWLPIRREEVPLTSFQREINRVFDDFFNGFGLRGFTEGTAAVFTPKIDVVNSEKSVTVRAEVPGLAEKDFDISVSDDHLILRGEKKHEEKHDDGSAHYYESSYGQFERVIPLNFEVDKDKIEATLKKGVLQITLPKSAKSQDRSRQISVKSE